MTAFGGLRWSGAALAVALGLVAMAPTAHAHPHMYIKSETTILVAGGTVTGFQHRWTFDEFYTAMAIQGLDTDKDGKYSRKELADLAKVNMDGLKEFGYFTFASLGKQKLAAEPGKDYWLEHTNGQLSLHFTVMLKSPVLLEAKDFTVGVYDPSYYISFAWASETAIKLADNAPKTCKVTLKAAAGADTDKMDKLGEAFFQQFGGNIGMAMARVAEIKCGVAG
ncbi:MAG: DUF1007 family protein [Hyphomicrobiaceae bacterium]|nr:DUF1007 family protein [Hyphomicrobiaceae bacterium]